MARLAVLLLGEHPQQVAVVEVEGAEPRRLFGLFQVSVEPAPFRLRRLFPLGAALGQNPPADVLQGIALAKVARKFPAVGPVVGQKMRANLALALIHDPDVVYLDEPTIGLDVLAKDNIRAFLREINKEKNTTVLLTTHDMTDIESVCDRLVLINSGSVLYDGGLNAFKEQYSKGYSIRVTFADPKEAIQDTRFELIEKKDAESIYHVSQSDFQPGEALAFLASHCKMQDISIIETPIEEIVKAIYKHEA